MKSILQYNKIIWVFILLLIFTGIFTYLQLPKREIPEINVNVSAISTVYPGATPQEVERTIINPLEEKLMDTEGVDKVTSASTSGFGTVTATLSGDNIDTVNAKIRQAVSDVSSSFPEEVQTPSVNTDTTMSAVASYHLMSNQREDLYQLREEIQNWETELTQISGVDSLLVKGLPEQKVTVSLDHTRLQEFQLSPTSIISTLDNELSPSPIGTEQKDGMIQQLIFDQYSEIEELKELYVGNNAEGAPITLSDVGSIEIKNKPVEDLISYKDKPALSITVLTEEGVNISAVQESLTEQVDALTNELPSGIDVAQFYTQSTIIDEVFTNLITSFAISFFAVIIIMILGLPLSSAILVALSIPISILIGLTPLPYVGVDLNQISIIGMIIAIGILVDDAIVVNDNIQRRFQLGDGALDGTIRGVKEVGKSIITSTLMIIFSFLPLTFLSGSNGDFIRALPSVLIFTVLASTIIALTFIPTVQYARKRRKGRTGNTKSGLLGGWFGWLERIYADRILPRTTKKPWATSLIGLLICVLLATLVIRIPFEFFPAADRPEVTISVENPQGTTIEDTEEKLKELAEFLESSDENISETAVFAGTGLPSLFSSGLERSGENTGQVLVRVDRNQTSASKFIEKWEEPLREEYPDSDIFLETIVSGPPPSPPVQIQMQGPELETLITEAENAQKRFSELNSSEIATINADSQPFTEYSIDRALLAENNIPINQVTSQMSLANVGIPLGTFDIGINRLPMEVIVDDGKEDGVALSELEVTSQSTRGAGPPASFTLDEIVTVNESTRLGVIPHLDGKRTITIEAYPEEVMESEFSEETSEIIDELKENLPGGYTIVESGESDARSDFFVEVTKLFVIVLFLIYLTIAIQFNSLLMPLLITGTVFLAVTGAIIGLFVSGEPLSFLAVLGIVSLSGIVVRNSVILVEFIEQNQQHFNSRVEAVIEAGRARIRPIVLTSLTSIAALAPIIYTGDVLFKPLAVSIVSGLAFSTVLTLLLVPSFYLILTKNKQK